MFIKLLPEEYFCSKMLSHIVDKTSKNIFQKGKYHLIATVHANATETVVF